MGNSQSVPHKYRVFFMVSSGKTRSAVVRKWGIPHHRSIANAEGIELVSFVTDCERRYQTIAGSTMVVRHDDKKDDVDVVVMLSQPEEEDDGVFLTRCLGPSSVDVSLENRPDRLSGPFSKTLVYLRSTVSGPINVLKYRPEPCDTRLFSGNLLSAVVASSACIFTGIPTTVSARVWRNVLDKLKENREVRNETITFVQVPIAFRLITSGALLVTSEKKKSGIGYEKRDMMELGMCYEHGASNFMRDLLLYSRCNCMCGSDLVAALAYEMDHEYQRQNTLVVHVHGHAFVVILTSASAWILETTASFPQTRHPQPFKEIAKKYTDEGTFLGAARTIAGQALMSLFELTRAALTRTDDAASLLQEVRRVIRELFREHGKWQMMADTVLRIAISEDVQEAKGYFQGEVVNITHPDDIDEVSVYRSGAKLIKTAHLYNGKLGQWEEVLKMFREYEKGFDWTKCIEGTLHRDYGEKDPFRETPFSFP